MKTVAIVPMKLNNERLPQKNTKNFLNGKPLCHYILTTLLSIEEIDEVYVYCSDSTIIEFLPDGVKYLKRSKNLDLNTTKMNEVLISFAKNIAADIYVMTHVTAPFISAASIVKGLQAVKNMEYDSAFAVKKTQNFLWENNSPLNYDLNNIPRTQDIKPIYEETSGFYIYESSIISKLGRRIGNNPYLHEINKIESIDIDDIEDFEIADAIFNYKFK